MSNRKIFTIDYRDTIRGQHDTYGFEEVVIQVIYTCILELSSIHPRKHTSPAAELW